MRALPIVSLALVAACSPARAVAPAEPAAAAPASVATSVPSATSVTSVPSAEPPVPTAAAAASAEVAAPSASAATEPAPAERARRTGGKLVELGMHIGGGPNDEATKNRVRRSTTPLFEAFRDCWARRSDAARPGHVGFDLRIPAHGGAITVDHPRDSVGDPEVVLCIASVLRGARFEGLGRETVVSWSLRLEP